MEGAVALPESEDKGLRGIEDGMSMVLDTKNSSLQNATKLIFATKRVVTLYWNQKCAWGLLPKIVIILQK